MGLKGPWIANGAFGPPLFMRNFAIGHIDWGVTFQFANLVSHLSSDLFQTIFPIFGVTEFIAVLHAGSLVSCHNFLSLYPSVNNLGQVFYILQTGLSELLYSWRFTTSQFVLAPSLPRLMARDFFFRLNLCDHSHYITSCLMSGWVSLMNRLCLYQVYVLHI
jgi:hypothetical protein